MSHMEYPEEQERIYGQEKLEIVARGFSRTIKSTAEQLEIITKNMDRSLSTLQASQMPEYQTALNALNSYAEAIGNKVRRLK